MSTLAAPDEQNSSSDEAADEHSKAKLVANEGGMAQQCMEEGQRMGTDDGG